MSGEAGRGWRGDIQAMRALAVTAVVAFHLGVPGCGRGYLGVDVFFVISGYLIGGRLEAMVVTGGWGGLAVVDLGRFWHARVARLWPAAVVTLGLTALACAVVLDRYELRQFLWQLAGSAALVGNVVLWQQTDYFGGSAATKPLLHFWSLAVEEQFYLAVPLAFFLRNARARRAAIAATTALSLGLYLVLAPRSPSAAFYLLPTRGWELGLGIMLALHDPSGILARAIGILRAMRAVAWVGLIALVVSGPVLDDTTALLLSVVLAAWLVAVPPRTQRIPRWVSAIGDRSYATYLVHWPIIALAANVWMRGPSPWVRAGLLVLIVLAAEALWRGVDGRDRTRRRVGPYLVAQALVMVAALLALGLMPRPVGEAFREPNEGLGLACNRSGAFDLVRACRSGGGADTVVWGDSFAMQLVPGLAATLHPGVIQATRVVCAPVAGFAPVGPGYSPDWAARCISFNDSVLAAVMRDPSIHAVVMAGIFNQLVDRATPGWQFASWQNGRLVVGPQDDAKLASALLDTIARLQHAGKRVVLYRPQPYPDYDVGRCLSRRAEGLPVLGVATDCGFAHAEQAPGAHAVDDFFDALLAHAGTSRTWGVIDPANVLCPQGRCLVREEGVPLFADMVHLSQSGSVWLSQKMNMAKIVKGQPQPMDPRKPMNGDK